MNTNKTENSGIKCAVCGEQFLCYSDTQKLIPHQKCNIDTFMKTKGI